MSKYAFQIDTIYCHDTVLVCNYLRQVILMDRGSVFLGADYVWLYWYFRIGLKNVNI